MMTDADLIWNRAAMDNGGKSPRVGDRVLSSLLHAHGLVMNGGVLHAVELLTADELADAQVGYRFFGFASVADLIVRARTLFEKGRNLGKHESALDAEYLKQIPADSALVKRFEKRFRAHPDDFAPL